MMIRVPLTNFKKIIFFFLLGFPMLGFATNYYVDANNGNDGADGKTTSTAWKTFTKVNAQTFVGGDSLLFKRGNTFSGMLAPKGSGTTAAYIVISSYGIGAKPIISGGTNAAAIKLN